MRHWCLTTIQYNRSGDRYTTEILPRTVPLMEDYARRHDMDFRLMVIEPQDTVEFAAIRTRGTECVYASIPKRLELLEQYDGVVYLDADMVIIDPLDDICLEVSPDQPVGMVEGLTAALQVLYSCLDTRQMLTRCWDHRDYWKTQHWAEEGFFKAYFGYDPVFTPHTHQDGGRAHFLGPTEHTAKLKVLDDSWCAHPLDSKYRSLREPRMMNPGGMRFPARLSQIDTYIGRAHALREQREGRAAGPLDA